MQLSKEIFVKLKESVAFFSSFSTGELIALLKLAKTETFEEEDVIFKENTRGDKMYIILNGVVRISRNIGKNQEEILVKLKPGACFGEMGVIDQSPRSASATVEGGKAILLSIRENLLSEHNVLLAYKLYKNFSLMLAERLRETNDKFQNASAGDRNASSQLRTLIKKQLDKGGSLAGANLKGVDLSETFMNNANLEGAILVQAKLTGTRCKQTVFKNANFTNSEWNAITFDRTNFEGADFTATKFTDVKFQSCNFKDAKFIGAELTDAQIDELPDDVSSKPSR
ncbi:MAG: hypothetical protein COB67_00820 [SAR324 cluster bacterium]|uniref:Cyclic nucleotide-binding domain-containing protein n=1 Tax=SAR324 cluster bacterium TaxID=2024889 RepID=A0A2A4TC62_9DELT|nr:MAG: hypothetical protein COB67_00820 [SAR324 cluster bacterium]